MLITIPIISLIGELLYQIKEKNEPPSYFISIGSTFFGSIIALVIAFSTNAATEDKHFI